MLEIIFVVNVEKQLQFSHKCSSDTQREEMYEFR